MQKYRTSPIRGLKCWPDWQISQPYLKLALKYGVVGPWRNNRNRSVVFDAYAMTRGPAISLPNGADLLVTILMNSSVKNFDLARLEDWLSVGKNEYELEKVRKTLASTSGLEGLTEKDLTILGGLIDEMILDDVRLKHFRGAKVFKWLSAWAPSHVPMIDNLLHDAMAGYRPNYPKRFQPAAVLLKDFQELLRLNIKQLSWLGQELSRQLPGKLLHPISPVRVLDSLLWFDWVLESYPEFNGVWFNAGAKVEHELIRDAKQL